MELPIRGIIPPVVTPLVNDDELDEQGLNNLLNHIVDGGVHGIFLLGTTGEATSLRYRVRRQLVEKACLIVNKRVPVMVGITDTSFERSVEMAEFCKEVGADMVVIAAPYYFPIAQVEMQRYLEDLVPRLPLPFMLYNMPSHTKIHFTKETVDCAKELGALGIKDSSGDMLYLLSLIDAYKDSPEFSVLTGTEIFLPETILQGGHGAVAGGANIFPRLFVDFYQASLDKDYAKIEFLRRIVMKIYNTIYNVGTFTSRYTVGTKCALGALGICNDYVAHPLRQFEGADHQAMANYVEEIKEMMGKAAFF
ncbi:4-hydroxy-tetrahydrodipicolinate synthase [Mariniphaga anaerophila]|uniref:4-hydroxy-tetrahydrodipicolinate synthase n=1 Tax=Mariniphaga anaerophila TaxID=1484053 RepID=A0A1M4ZX89_9BACT|nr:dihydrodipicolinate synthase family protein [Mariniphaga anaerophila]SHF22663.1 4-hydroxy-tetrahydrodipicolinate synthase [Mariniphaga anaerophila]